MTTLEDLDLRPDEPEPEPLPPPPRPPIGLIAAAIAVLFSAGLWFWWQRKPRTVPSAPPPTQSAATPEPTARPTPLDLPALDGSDPLVRQLAGELSSDSLFASWLATASLVRTVAAATVHVADGGSPRPQVGFLAPPGAFAVVQRKAGLAIDPASYARYDAFASAVASIAAESCARVYGQLEPLFDIAYRELGYPRGRFRDALLRAAQQLIDAPVAEGDVAVRPVRRATLVYELVDPRLEALSPAPKHLLRMGPANTRRLQASLRAFLAALEAQGTGTPEAASR